MMEEVMEGFKLINKWMENQQKTNRLTQVYLNELRIRLERLEKR